MKKTLSRLFYVLLFAVLTAALTLGAMYIFGFNNEKSILNWQNHNVETVNTIDIDDDTQFTYKKITVEDYTPSPYYEPVKISIGRDSLESDSEKKLYDSIADSIVNISETKDENDHYRTRRVTIKGEHMSEKEIRRSINAFMYDNPQVFWLDNLFGYAYVGEDTLAEFYSTMSADECQQKQTVMHSAVNMIMSSMEDGMSEFEREKFIHDYIIRNTIYNSTVKNISDGWEYFSVYGPLVKGEAVCEGYAKAQMFLLNLCGIECTTIRGSDKEEGVGHMWNLVKIDGEWYHLDPTWDDSENGPLYDYFNVNDNMIKMTHTISPAVDEVSTEEDSENDMSYNFFLPECTSTEAGYYSKNAAVIETFDSETNQMVIDAIVSAAENREEYFSIVFGREMEYEEYVDAMFFVQPYKFYSYVNAANERLDDEHKIDVDGLSLYKNEDALLVRVALAYIEKNYEMAG